MSKSPESVIGRMPDRDDYITVEQERERATLFSIWYIEPSADLYQVRKRVPSIAETFKLTSDPTIPPEERIRRLEESNRHVRDGIEQIETYDNDRKHLIEIGNRRMAKCQKDKSKRPYWIKPITSGDVDGDLQIAFDFNCQEIESYAPEIVVIRADKDIYSGDVGSAEVERIRNKVREAAERLDIEESLIQPIIALIISDPELTEKYMEQGANLVVPDLNIDDIDKLAQLAAKIKSDPASLAPEKVIAEKKAFYEKVEGMEMTDRSQITADTKQELEILKELLPEGKIEVLDVGCGAGRITNRLTSDTINVTGMDTAPGLLEEAREANSGANYVEGNLMDYTSNPEIKHGSKDAVIYTWHSFLEAFGPGNTIRTLNSAWLALREGGTLIFDQPTRENQDLADGWYYSEIDEETEYLSYIMTEEEIEFMLNITGFEDVEFTHWKTKPSELYHDGMDKITVKAKKRSSI